MEAIRLKTLGVNKLIIKKVEAKPKFLAEEDI